MKKGTKIRCTVKSKGEIEVHDLETHNQKNDLTRKKVWPKNDGNEKKDKYTNGWWQHYHPGEEIYL